MGTQSEGGQAGDSRAHPGAPGLGDDNHYRSPRDMDSSGYLQQQQQQEKQQQQQLMRQNNGYGQDNRVPAPPNQSIQRKDSYGGDSHKDSADRERSRTRHNRKGSAQNRLCKKCGEPLTGQFVRALGGTFHLDCFKCRVSSVPWRVC